MNCNRCGSSMSYEQFFGKQEHFWGWRCIKCGEVVDRTILENRSGEFKVRTRESNRSVKVTKKGGNL